MWFCLIMQVKMSQSNLKHSANHMCKSFKKISSLSSLQSHMLTLDILNNNFYSERPLIDVYYLLSVTIYKHSTIMGISHPQLCVYTKSNHQNICKQYLGQNILELNLVKKLAMGRKPQIRDSMLLLQYYYTKIILNLKII